MFLLDNPQEDRPHVTRTELNLGDSMPKINYFYPKQKLMDIRHGLWNIPLANSQNKYN